MGNHRGYCLKTGQRKMIESEAGWLMLPSDGFDQMGLSRRYTLRDSGSQYEGTVDITVNAKTHQLSNNVVVDEMTGLMWPIEESHSVGPSSNGTLHWDDRCVHLEGTISVDDFLIGELVTQAVTGATGIVRYADNVEDEIFVANVTGTFTASSNAVTGGDSGATIATVSAVTDPDSEDIWEYLYRANLAELGGFSDWRIPNIRELATIAMFDDFTKGDADPDTDYFPSGWPNRIWSSTTREATFEVGGKEVCFAWAMCFGPGAPGTFGSTNTFYHKPTSLYKTTLVRGPDLSKRRLCRTIKTGQVSSSLGAFPDDGVDQAGLDISLSVISGGQHAGTTDIVVQGTTEAMSNQVVLDKNTGLMWTRDATGTIGASGAVVFVEEAAGTVREDAWEFLAEANKMKLAGYDDWRLPNIFEAISVYAYGTNNLDADYFNHNGQGMWTTTRSANDATRTLIVAASGLGSGNGGVMNTATYKIRLVRGGVKDEDVY